MIDFNELRKRMKDKEEARKPNPGPLLYVVNVRLPSSTWPTFNWHYVGRKMGHSLIYRGSSLGNPYHLGRGDDRGATIDKYTDWISDHLVKRSGPQWDELVEILGFSLDVNGLCLGCWCHPEPCHADIIKLVVECMWETGVRPDSYTQALSKIPDAPRVEGVVPVAAYLGVDRSADARAYIFSLSDGRQVAAVIEDVEENAHAGVLHRVPVLRQAATRIERAGYREEMGFLPLLPLPHNLGADRIRVASLGNGEWVEVNPWVLLRLYGGSP